MGREVEFILRVTLFGKACDLEVVISKVIFVEHCVFFSNVVNILFIYLFIYLFLLLF
jgi:hypothetical protein